MLQDRCLSRAKTRSAVALFKWQRRLIQHHKRVVHEQSQVASHLSYELRQKEVEVHALAGERVFLERTAKYFQALADRAVTLVESRGGTTAAEQICNSAFDVDGLLTDYECLHSLDVSSPSGAEQAPSPEIQQLLELASPATSATNTTTTATLLENDENAGGSLAYYGEVGQVDAQQSKMSPADHNPHQCPLAPRPLQERSYPRLPPPGCPEKEFSSKLRPQGQAEDTHGQSERCMQASQEQELVAAHDARPDQVRFICSVWSKVTLWCTCQGHASGCACAVLYGSVGGCVQRAPPCAGCKHWS